MQETGGEYLDILPISLPSQRKSFSYFQMVVICARSNHLLRVFWAEIAFPSLGGPDWF